MFEIITNPIFIAVIFLCALCVLRVNVLLALLLSSILGGLVGRMSLTETMNVFIGGMGENAETALSYILLGAFAASMTHIGLAPLLAKKISKIINTKKYLLIFIIAGIAVLSQNLIPVHIAFIPILIPPLLAIMNKLKIDRRAIACALTFGLNAPYITIPAGFGLIFQTLIADNIIQNGVNVVRNDVWKSLWVLGVAMFIGLLVAVFITYRNPREYLDIVIENQNTEENLKFNKTHYITLFAALSTLLVQLWTKSLPLGALIGLSIIFGCRVVRRKDMDKLIDDGIGMMGYVAFVMLVAAGFAAVMKSTGSIDALVSAVIPFMSGKIIAATLMTIIGLFITMGIGTSFGTIPILGVLYVPICIHLGFSVSSIVVIIAASAALGDAGSPASDATLGPTSGLNADGQHNHISDTCIPTFLHFNIPLIIATILAVMILR